MPRRPEPPLDLLQRPDLLQDEVVLVPNLSAIRHFRVPILRTVIRNDDDSTRLFKVEDDFKKALKVENEGKTPVVEEEEDDDEDDVSKSFEPGL